MDAEPRLIVKCRASTGQLRLYEGEEGLELDSFESGEIVRRRLFYDEILLVTLHRSINWLLLVASVAVATLFGFVALSVARSDSFEAAVVTFGLTGLPFVLIALFSSVLGSHTVTICGRRSRAKLPLGMRSARAREVFQAIARLVEDRQPR